MQKIMNSTMRTYDAPLYAWPLAALHVINTVLNVMPNKRIGMDTPHLGYTGRHFDYTELQPFWPADRQKYHPAIIVSVDHTPQVQHRYQAYFDSADSHSTQYADTDAVIISPDQKAMLLALRDTDSDPADLPSDAFMDEPDPATYRQAQAFLQALIPEDERCYVRFPKGYVHPLGYVGAYMKKALYGHRTSGRLWSETAHRFMTDRYPTLSRSTYDECLHIGWIDGQLFIVLIYVDDFIVACANERSRAQFHTDIMSTFQATYSGVLNQF
eukprot:gene34520-biopygen32541